MARRLSNKTSPKSRGKVYEQMILDGTIKDARLAEVEHLDGWKSAAEAAAHKRWLEIRDARRLCQGGVDGKACALTAVIWVLSWSTAPKNSTWCLKHWPQGEGKAIESEEGWLPDGNAVADTGWNSNRSWSSAGAKPRAVRTAHGMGFTYL